MKIYFDTTVFCGAFEGTLDQIALLEPLFKLAESKPMRIATSDLTLAELLGTETEKGWAWQSRFYADLLIHSGYISVLPVSRDILVETGSFRRQATASGRKVRLADAIHAITARQAGCQYIFTFDKRFYAPEPLSIAGWDEAGVATVKTALDA